MADTMDAILMDLWSDAYKNGGGAITRAKERLAAITPAGGVEAKADAITNAASAIMDVFCGGDPTWRTRIERSKLLESADWARAVELARAALLAGPSPKGQEAEPTGDLKALADEFAERHRQALETIEKYESAEAGDWMAMMPPEVLVQLQEDRRFYFGAMMLLAKAPKGQEAEGWKPMDQAPKDGTTILLWDDVHRVAVSGRWHVEPEINSPNYFNPGWADWSADNNAVMWDDGGYGPLLWRHIDLPATSPTRDEAPTPKGDTDHER